MKTSIILLSSCILINAAKAQNVILYQDGGTLSIQPDATMSIEGGIQMSNAAVLHLDGNLLLKSNPSATQTDVNIPPGNSITGNGILMTSSDKAVFFNAPDLSVPSLHINNIGSATLNNNLKVRNTFTLNRGLVYTGSSRLEILSNLFDAVTEGPSNAGFSQSYIVGTLRRSLTTNDEYYEFPLGKLSGSRRLTFVNQNLTGLQYIDASFGPKNGTDAGLSVSEGGTSYSSVHSEGVWTLAANAVPTSGNYILKASLNGFDGLTDNKFGLLLRPAGSGNGAEWKLPLGSSLPVTGQPGRTVASGLAQRNAIHEFGEFGLGQMAGALPVTLAVFKGKEMDDGSHEIEWETSQEANSSYFSVQLSMDGKSFSEIGRVEARNQPKQLYRFTNKNPGEGINYYRLKMVDLDGSYANSRIVDLEGKSRFTVYPNPLKGDESLHVSGQEDLRQICIYNESGKAVYSSDSPGGEINIAQLKAGFYLVKLITKHGSVNLQKIVKY